MAWAVVGLRNASGSGSGSSSGKGGSGGSGGMPIIIIIIVMLTGGRSSGRIITALAHLADRAPPAHCSGRIRRPRCRRSAARGLRGGMLTSLARPAGAPLSLRGTTEARGAVSGLASRRFLALPCQQGRKARDAQVVVRQAGPDGGRAGRPGLGWRRFPLDCHNTAPCPLWMTQVGAQSGAAPRSLERPTGKAPAALQRSPCMAQSGGRTGRPI
eukprot:scaffold3827_cov394-Prasinococcus_capsulatus_cf.AAC.5